MNDWPKLMVAEYISEGGRAQGYNTDDYEVEFEGPVEVIPADLGRELYGLLRGARELLGMSWSDGDDPDDIAGRVDAALTRYEREVGSSAEGSADA